MIRKAVFLLAAGAVAYAVYRYTREKKIAEEPAGIPSGVSTSSNVHRKTADQAVMSVNDPRVASTLPQVSYTPTRTSTSGVTSNVRTGGSLRDYDLMLFR
jgi:hypothetical protein